MAKYMRVAYTMSGSKTHAKKKIKKSFMAAPIRQDQFRGDSVAEAET